jgi:cysteine desulfurase
VPPGTDGRVDVEAFLDACGPETVVASLMLASNETGVIQPVAEVAAELRERGIIVHTDAVQAIGKVPVSFRDLGVDLLSISAHKFGGPKGAGALLVRRGTELEPLQGGTQEAGRRGGTHAVHAIVGLGEAVHLVPERLVRMREIETLRDRLQARLCEQPSATVHGLRTPRVPNTCLIGFDGVDAAAVLMAADLQGLCLSRGAACASGAEAPSHVLSAMGVPASLALGTVRLSLGVETTAAEIEHATATLTAAVERHRSAGGARAIH